MHPVLQKIGVRSAELLIVDLKTDALSFIAAEVNKLLQSENNDVNISQLKAATEKYASFTYIIYGVLKDHHYDCMQFRKC